MAIDGTQIIDSDLAHDIYNEFMELYDANAPIASIRKRIESWRSELSDDLEREIFLSVYCQALWEIGEPAHGEVVELESNVNSERGLKIWKGLGEDLYHERKKVLARQLSKLSKPRKKSRSRKKHKKIENFLFEVGSCLIYKADNGNLSALLVCDISQYRNECLYSMTPELLT